MKLFQWIVMIRCNSGHFYGCVAPGRYLTGVLRDDAAGCYKPEFGDDAPVLYPRSSASFQARELRRVGYCVRTVPYALVMLLAWIQKRKNSVWRR